MASKPTDRWSNQFAKPKGVENSSSKCQRRGAEELEISPVPCSSKQPHFKNRSEQAVFQFSFIRTATLLYRLTRSHDAKGRSQQKKIVDTQVGRHVSSSPLDQRLRHLSQFARMLLISPLLVLTALEHQNKGPDDPRTRAVPPLSQGGHPRLANGDARKGLGRAGLHLTAWQALIP